MWGGGQPGLQLNRLGMFYLSLALSVFSEWHQLRKLRKGGKKGGGQSHNSQVALILSVPADLPSGSIQVHVMLL